MKKALLLMATVTLVACSNGNKEEATTNNKEETTQTVKEEKEEKQEKEFGFIDDKTIEHKEFSVNILDIWIEDSKYDDSEMIAFEYEMTNKTDEEMGNDIPFMFYMQALQDNDPDVVNSLDFASPKEYGLEEYKQVKPGGSTVYGTGFTLTDDTTPVTLKLSDERFQDLDSHEYDISDLERR